VSPTSRWPKMVARVGVSPRGKRVYGPPADVRATVPSRWDGVHCKSPSEQLAHRLKLHCCRRGFVEVSDHGHRPGVGVEPAGVAALDGAGDAADRPSNTCPYRSTREL